MRIGFISDIHEDIDNLRLAVKKLEAKSCEKIVCLGDIVGFSGLHYPYESTRSAERCVKLIQAICEVTVAGNHELFAIQKIPAYNAGFEYPDDWYKKSIEEQDNISKGLLWDYSTELENDLSSNSVDFLKALPESKILEVEGLKLHCSHFHYPNFSGSKAEWPTNVLKLRQHFLYTKDRDIDYSFSGHGHYSGALCAGRMRMHQFDFGDRLSLGNWKWISGPAVARNKNASGCMFLDTQSMELEIIQI